MASCKWCDDVDPDEGTECLDQLGVGMMGCTRPKGHDGPHVACGIIHHAICAWDDNGESVELEDK